ncbi:hypothetical protein AB1282_19895 [Gottfriedia sp. S16(2024)]
MNNIIGYISRFFYSGADDEYVMIFAPVKNRKDCTLEVGNELKIPLTN